MNIQDVVVVDGMSRSGSRKSTVAMCHEETSEEERREADEVQAGEDAMRGMLPRSTSCPTPAWRMHDP